jgi:transposase-like protein
MDNQGVTRPHPAPGATEETGGERSETPVSGGAEGAGCGPRPIQPPIVIADPEVPERARRRRFSAKYKLRVLDEADRCSQPGELGELLRREGLYSSHLTCWRKQRREGSLQGLEPRKRGRKAQPKNPLTKRVSELERENEILRKRIEQAELIIDVQKKVSQILGVTLETPENSENDS